VALCHIDERFPGLEGRHEAAFLIRVPGSSHLVWKLGPSLGPSSHLLQRRDAGEQRPQYIGLLEDCRSRKLLPGHRVDTLDERLKYLPCTLLLHV